MFSCFKTKSEKNLLREIYLYMPQKHEIYGVFTVFQSFRGKISKKYSIGNEE